MNNKKSQHNIIYLPSEQLINNFVEDVVKYITNGKNDTNYIIIGANYLYLEEELLEIINAMRNNVELFIEKSSNSIKLLLDIDFKWTLIYGYKILVKKEHNNYHHFVIYRQKIKILYLTDKTNDLLESCKKCIYHYCKKFNYTFIHQHSKYFNTFFNRLEYTSRNILDDEYVCVLYNYSYIVNYDLTLTDIIRILCLDKFTVLLDYANKKLLKHNFMIRNSRRLIDIVKELKYFEDDDIKMENYIKDCLSTEVNISSVHSYINKKGGYYTRAGFLDLVHTMNDYKDEEYEYDMMNIIHKHMGCNNTNNLCSNESFFSIVGKVYTTGSMVSGCNGTITFLKDNRLLYPLSEEYGNYKKLNNYSYEISLDGKKYILIFFNNYKQYIGTQIDKIGDAIVGNLLR